MKLVIGEPYVELTGPFDAQAAIAITRLTGRKYWKGDDFLRAEATASNIKTLLKAQWAVEDPLGVLNELARLSAAPTQNMMVPYVTSTFTPQRTLAEFQQQILALSWDRPAYAILLDMGLRKTATTLINIGYLAAADILTGALIVCNNGLQKQWLEELLPLDWDSSVPRHTLIWKGRPIKWPKTTAVELLAINYEAVRSPNGFAVARDFIARHNGKLMMVADESQHIKTYDAKQTEACQALGDRVSFRRILTGTPFSRNLEDAWSQYKFLDERILGYKNITPFRNHFCILGANYTTVGNKNEEEFWKLVAPHTYRRTKQELGGLPPKVYSVRPYEVDAATRLHYQNLKRTFMTQLDDGTIVDVKSALVMWLRLQQVVCGYLPGANGTEDEDLHPISDIRLDVLGTVLDQLDGPTIIWARFRPDIRRVKARLINMYGPRAVVTYYGADSETERYTNKTKFIDGHAQFFISNPAVGGEGVDGLQKVCHSVVYYSNSFQALHRWQSEDRTWRDGMGDLSCTYIDILARSTVDTMILSNLREKKSMSDLTLDEIRLALAEEIDIPA